MATRGTRIVGVGTATQPNSYTQTELLDHFGITAPRVRGVFLNGGIERRYLHLPDAGPDGAPVVESQGELLDKHRADGVAMGAQAVRTCLKRAGRDLSDVRFLCSVSSTGWVTPGLSALLCRELELSWDCGRLDVVGMGCNAGLSALPAVTGWAEQHPGELALLLCVEVCSAAYVFDSTMRSAVVNSLFGDGAAALAVIRDEPEQARRAAGPEILGYASYLIPDSLSAMRYDWDSGHGKFSFYLDRDIPYVVGAHAERVVDKLLARAGLGRRDVAHWVVHSGGRKVIDAVKINLGLTRHDLRHTSGVLRDFGNLSSGSFLFSYERLLEEDVAQPGDYGVLMAMGPGSTIETGLIRW
ncbi:polyketide synthase [Acrocarpospora phusangensis]|uniref:Polyketide synthase n=1 Tax=Acrocarpospora phusangensis TaxID=1070424 RepID=A0A919QI53_9ACTN|nr:3,5-dihydroxyphenylacetyl-CoA synthase DpgA [Acrocarpospora phusangensis]GIH27840.1 polyketide synthase [Acrocarpospora phusangensis]